jgi:DMSO/TMAO reductase YedYZ molybdopterin-dependent catalytic subunit
MMKNPFKRNTAIKQVTRQQLNRRNFLAFSAFAGMGALVYGGWHWLNNSALEASGVTAGRNKLLRRALNKNELILRNVFSNKHLVKTYPKSMAAKNVRVNSDIGMKGNNFDATSWMLAVNKNDGTQLKVSLKDIMALPKTEIIFDFKCVEGWDQISYWGGVKFSDFITHYNLQQEAAMQYVGMATPDDEYYVGMDMESVMHPQTLLAYEVNAKLLPMEHGQPLRLIVPVKYGIKNLKRIGSISFSNQRLPDYWAEQGYDYYSGL